VATLAGPASDGERRPQFNKLFHPWGATYASQSPKLEWDRGCRVIPPRVYWMPLAESGARRRRDPTGNASVTVCHRVRLERKRLDNKSALADCTCMQCAADSGWAACRQRPSDKRFAVRLQRWVKSCMRPMRKNFNMSAVS
jgi:hypothetical protein